MQLPYKQKLLTSSWLFRVTKQHMGETDTILMRLKVNYSNTEGLKLTDCKFNQFGQYDSYEDSHTNSVITRSPTPANLTMKCC